MSEDCRNGGNVRVSNCNDTSTINLIFDDDDVVTYFLDEKLENNSSITKLRNWNGKTPRAKTMEVFLRCHGGTFCYDGIQYNSVAPANLESVTFSQDGYKQRLHGAGYENRDDLDSNPSGEKEASSLVGMFVTLLREAGHMKKVKQLSRLLFSTTLVEAYNRVETMLDAADNLQEDQEAALMIF